MLVFVLVDGAGTGAGVTRSCSLYESLRMAWKSMLTVWRHRGFYVHWEHRAGASISGYRMLLLTDPDVLDVFGCVRRVAAMQKDIAKGV